MKAQTKPRWPGLRDVSGLRLTEGYTWIMSETATGLRKESVANVSQIATLDRSELTERAGKLPKAKLELVLTGVDVVLGR